MTWYKQAQDKQKTLYLMRGAPGSGKSTLAKQLGGGGLILSTDDFFVIEGQYLFNATMLGQAHNWNLQRATEAMAKGITPIVIDNTNTRAREMRPYAEAAIKYGYKIEIKEPETPWKLDIDELVKRNTHGVSRETIEKMVNRLQQNVTLEDVLREDKPEAK